MGTHLVLSINSTNAAIRRVKTIMHPGKKKRFLLCNKYVPSSRHILKVIN